MSDWINREINNPTSNFLDYTQSYIKSTAERLTEPNAEFTEMMKTHLQQYFVNYMEERDYFKKIFDDLDLFKEHIETSVDRRLTNYYNDRHPIGTLYMTTNPANPGTYIPGTEWEPWGSGRVPTGFSENDVEFNAVNKTGGNKTHQLTSLEMPSHTHIQNSHTHNQNSHGHNQLEHTHTQVAHTHIQNAHTHTQDAHNHTQNEHTHTQTGHTHIQNAHTHTQNSHTHTQVAHTHIQNAHTHNHVNSTGQLLAWDGTFALYSSVDTANSGALTTGDVAAGTRNFSSASGNGRPLRFDLNRGGFAINNRTAENQNATPTINGTTAVNQNFTAVNQSTIALNANTRAVNLAATVLNQNFTAVNQDATPTINPYTGQNIIHATAFNQSTTPTNQHTGSDNAHNNLSPYIVCYYWIRRA